MSQEKPSKRLIVKILSDIYLVPIEKVYLISSIYHVWVKFVFFVGDDH